MKSTDDVSLFDNFKSSIDAHKNWAKYRNFWLNKIGPATFNKVKEKFSAETVEVEFALQQVTIRPTNFGDVISVIVKDVIPLMSYEEKEALLFTIDIFFDCYTLKDQDLIITLQELENLEDEKTE